MSVPQEDPVPDPGEAIMRISRGVESGDDAEANAGMLALMVEAMKNLDLQDPDSDLSLKQRMRELEAAGEIADAEAIHLKLIARFQKNGPEGQLFKAHHDYGWFLDRQGRPEEAQEQSEVALASARRQDMEPLVWMALHQCFTLAVKRDELDQALRYADEMISIGGEERMYATQKGRSFMSRADVRIRMGDLDNARADLVRAREILGGAWSPMGGKVDLARCCEMEAKVAAERGDPEQELGRLEAAAECYRVSPSFFFSMNSSVLERRSVLFEKLAEARRRAGDTQGAAQAREEGETSPILACPLSSCQDQPAEE